MMLMRCAHLAVDGTRCPYTASYDDQLCVVHHGLFSHLPCAGPGRARIATHRLPPMLMAAPSYAHLDIYLRPRLPDDPAHRHAIFLPYLCQPHPEFTPEAWMLVLKYLHLGANVRVFAPQEREAEYLVDHLMTNDYKNFVTGFVPDLEMV